MRETNRGTASQSLYQERLFLRRTFLEKTVKVAAVAGSIIEEHEQQVAREGINRQIILAYPTDFLRKLAEANGGIHDLSSALLFRLKQNITLQEVQATNAKLVKSSIEITDNSLEKGLRNAIR